MIKALLRTDVPGFTNSSISIFMTFITAKFFQPIFFSPCKKRAGTFLLEEDVFTHGLGSSHRPSPPITPPHPSGRRAGRFPQRLWWQPALQSWARCSPVHNGTSTEDVCPCSAQTLVLGWPFIRTLSQKPHCSTTLTPDYSLQSPP